jgi:hypothetical protein
VHEGGPDFAFGRCHSAVVGNFFRERMARRRRSSRSAFAKLALFKSSREHRYIPVGLFRSVNIHGTLIDDFSNDDY